MKIRYLILFAHVWRYLTGKTSIKMCSGLLGHLNIKLNISMIIIYTPKLNFQKTNN